MKATLFDLNQNRIHDVDLPQLPDTLVVRGRALRTFIRAIQSEPLGEYYETSSIEISWTPSGDVVVETPETQRAESLQMLWTLILAMKMSIVGAPKMSIVGAPVTSVRAADTAVEDLLRLARNPSDLSPDQASILRAVVGVDP